MKRTGEPALRPVLARFQAAASSEYHEVGAGRARGLVKQLLELDLAFLEAGGVDVGEVVRDDVEVHLLGFHPGGGGVKGAKHKSK